MNQYTRNQNDCTKSIIAITGGTTKIDFNPWCWCHHL